ncbi:hypothetical protein [Streptomyces agglomeratus]|nr:hypothetical protein [Streptomyces agglomeratus]
MSHETRRSLENSGRLWTAITGTILGAAGFGSSITVVGMFSV